MASTVFNASVPSKLPLLHLLGRHPALCRFISIRSSDELCAQMLSVAVSWHVYAATHNAMSLAYAGLARFLPNIAVMLFAGHVADRFDRRWIISFAIGLQTLCVGTFGTLLATASLSVGRVYLLLLLFGAAQACSSPAMSALLPQLVSSEEFPHAVAVSSTTLQICALAGPAIGGLIYALSAPGMFLLCAALYFAAMAQLPFLAHGHHRVRAEEASETDQSPFGGIRYVWCHGLLRGIILLDLFAVLLGGVTALLPIYAKDILVVGPVGLGCLRCAPGIGAGIVGLILAHHTIQQGVGKLMLFSVAGFGFATVVFALSTHLWLSLAALVWAGGFDMVSMVIRQTLLQVATPDAMRGRVSAVQSVCIGASSELGEFESGATAALFGTVPASLLGGLGTLVVVLLWAELFPELARTDRFVTGQASSRSI